MTNKNYTADSVKVLNAIEGIRTRSGMYAGALDQTAIHLCREIIDNSADEYLNDSNTTIKVLYDTKLNKVTIIDTGRGMPVDEFKGTGKSVLEILVTENHAGAKFNKDSFKKSSGLNGVGCTVVNALSSFFKVTSIRDNKEHSIEFQQGKKTKDFEVKKNTNYPDIKHGTVIEFIPDKTILKDGMDKINTAILKKELDNKCYSIRGLQITYKENNKKEIVYHKPNGILDYFSTVKNKPLTEPFMKRYVDSDSNEYEIALGYFGTSNEECISYFNGILMQKGTQETGFKNGVTSAVKEFLKTDNCKSLIPKSLKLSDIRGEDIRSGLVYAINIIHDHGEFTGQTKHETTNAEFVKIIGDLVHSSLIEDMNNKPKMYIPVMKRIIEFAKGRIKANKVKESIIKADINTFSSNLSDKFSNCWGKDPSKNELILIEGKSAGTTVKTARDTETQAVYAMRGKPLNVYSATEDKIRDNLEIKEILTIIFGSNDPKAISKFNYDKMPYNRIIILTDADDDGTHIESLTLALFFKYTKLIQLGYVYLGLPPKYSYQERGKFKYFNNDEELHKFEFDMISKSLKLDKKSDYDLKDIIRIKEDYKREFDKIQYIHPIISKELLSDISKRDNIDLEKYTELEYNEDNGILKGSYLGKVIHTNLIDVCDSLCKLHNDCNIPLGMVSVEDKKGREFNDLSLIEIIDIIEKDYNFKYDYFKGLGEADAEELDETTLRVDKRNLVKVNIADIKESTDMTHILLSKNTTTERKDLMRNHFKEGEL